MSDMPIFAHTGVTPEGLHYLQCNRCGKSVSSPFMPTPTELGPKLVVRAWIECPECMEPVRCEHGHTDYTIGCVSCVLVFPKDRS